MDTLRVNTDELLQISNQLNGVADSLTSGAARLSRIDIEDVGNPRLDIRIQLKTQKGLIMRAWELEHVLQTISSGMEQVATYSTRLSSTIRSCERMFNECERKISSGELLLDSVENDSDYFVPLGKAGKGEVNATEYKIIGGVANSHSVKFSKENATEIIEKIYTDEAFEHDKFWFIFWFNTRKKHPELFKLRDKMTTDPSKLSIEDKASIAVTLISGLYQRETNIRMHSEKAIKNLLGDFIQNVASEEGFEDSIKVLESINNEIDFLPDNSFATYVLDKVYVQEKNLDRGILRDAEYIPKKMEALQDPNHFVNDVIKQNSLERSSTKSAIAVEAAVSGYGISESQKELADSLVDYIIGLEQDVIEASGHAQNQ